MTDSYRILFNIRPASWIVMAVLTLVSVIFFSREVTIGVVVGEILVAVSFLFFHRVLVRGLEPGSKVTPKSVLLKYYLRFAATVVILVILISQHLVSSLGLLLGLSSFILTIFAVLILEMGSVIRARIIKEAA